jgi:F0F1-type ATP synthase assembly protein I
MIEKPKIPWWQPGVVLFTRLSGWIAGPVIIAVFVGKWLDNKYNTAPWLFLLTVGIAFAISMFGIVREAMTELKKIDRENEKKKAEEEKNKKE